MRRGRAPGELWFAELTSWRGVSIGATHWYLKLRRGHGRSMEVERVLTADEARAETELDDRYTWNEGDWKRGWVTPEDAEGAALAAFRELAADPDLDVLVLGAGAYCVPDKTLAGPDAVRALLDALGPDDGDKMDHVIAEVGLVVRPGASVFGRGAPPEDPDLPHGLAVGGDKVFRISRLPAT